MVVTHVEQRRLHLSEVMAAKEVFLVGSSVRVVPIVRCVYHTTVLPTQARGQSQNRTEPKCFPTEESDVLEQQSDASGS